MKRETFQLGIHPTIQTNCRIFQQHWEPTTGTHPSHWIVEDRMCSIGQSLDSDDHRSIGYDYDGDSKQDPPCHQNMEPKIDQIKQDTWDTKNTITKPIDLWPSG